MSLIQRLGEWALLALFRLVAWFLLACGMAGLTVGLFRQLRRAFLDAVATDPNLLKSEGGFDDSTPVVALSRLGIKVAATFLPIGVALLYALNPERRLGSYPTARRAAVVAVLGLTGLGVWALLSAEPLMSLWRAGWAFADSLGIPAELQKTHQHKDHASAALILIFLGGLLHTPLLESATVLGFVAASILLLALLLARSRLFSTVCAACLLVLLALLMASFYSLELAGLVLPLLESAAAEASGREALALAAFVREHHAVAWPMARRLVWVFGGYFLLVLGLRRWAHQEDAPTE